MPGEKYKPDENQHARGPICQSGSPIGARGQLPGGKPDRQDARELENWENRIWELDL